MQQPAWNNNNWGYDTLAKPFAGGQLYLENSYSFLKNAGQWFLDPQAGQLYYKAAVRPVADRPRRRAAPPDLAGPDQRQLRQPGLAHHLPGPGLRAHHLARPEQLDRLRRPADRHVPGQAVQPARRLPVLLPVRLPAVRGHPQQLEPGAGGGPGLGRGEHHASAGTPSPTSARSASASATTRTPSPPASGLGRLERHGRPQHLHRRLRRRDRGRRRAAGRAPPVQHRDDRAERHDHQQPGDAASPRTTRTCPASCPPTPPTPTSSTTRCRTWPTTASTSAGAGA